jgi:hypothetical protein
MISFKDFIQHKNLSEAFNIPIRDHDDIDNYETKQDKKSLKLLLTYVKSLNLDDIPFAAGGNKIKIRGADDQSTRDKIKLWKAQNVPKLTGIEFGKGSIGTGGEEKIHKDTQELMVAALVLNRVKSESIDEIAAVKMIEDAKNVFNKIEGALPRLEILDQFNGNFNDLATAISSSNAILNICPNPVKVYWTGASWHKDIEKYNPPIGDIKNYNSSDIVVKNSDGVFYGFSLKKKASSRDVDPTLINKAVTGKSGFLKDILDKNIADAIEKSKDDFFDGVIQNHYNKNPRDLSEKEKSELLKGISQSKMGLYVKNPNNIFFKRTYELLSQNSLKFIKSFIELLFRSKMVDIEKGGEFKFYLLTGIGKFVKRQVRVEQALLQDIPSVIEMLTRIFNSKLELKRTPGQLQAWEDNTKAAKIFLSIFSDGIDIIDIQIRYKGNYAANPQFQAVATANFKKLFK